MKPLVPVLVTTALLATACATPQDEMRVQGSVAADVTVVSVPQLAVPIVDLDAGFAQTPPSSGEPDPTTVTMGDSRTATALGLGSFATVTEVRVHEGDRVTAGQHLVQLDDRLLRAGLRSAKADAAVAAVQVDVLKAQTADARDKQQEIADKRVDVVDALATLKDKRAEVQKAIKQVTKLRATLRSKRAEVLRTRADLVAKRSDAQKLLASYPPEPAPIPPGLPTREELQAAIAGTTAGIAKIDGALKKLNAGLGKLDKGLRQARTGLGKINQGITKATDGLHKLDKAADKIKDAIAQLGRLRRLAQVAADTAAVPVELAATQVKDAAVTAPVAGTVVSVVQAGDQLAPGATLVRIRPDQPATLTTWLSPDQTAAVCKGDSAAISADWLSPGETIPAQISRIATAAQFPPSSQATDEVHLTRAFLVELTTTTDLPAGAPVTLSIQPCRANASGTP